MTTLFGSNCIIEMTIRKTIAIFLCSLIISVATVSVPASKTQPEMWREVDDAALSRRPSVRTPTPENYRTFQLEKARLGNLLSTVPNEFSRMAASGDPVDKIIELPMPDGTLARFRFEHSLVVEPGLMAKYPELGATYRGYGIDDPTATVRFRCFTGRLSCDHPLVEWYGADRSVCLR